MAKVKSPLMSEAASGALAGIEYRTTPYGAVVGRRSIATPTRSAAATFHTLQLKRAKPRWDTLPAKVKAAWARHSKARLPAFSDFQCAQGRAGLAGVYIGFDDPNQVVSRRILNPYIDNIIPASRSFRVRWTCTGTGTNRVFVYTANSWRQLTNPPDRAFRWRGWAFTSALSVTLADNPFAPHVWVRVECLHRYGWQTLQRYYIRLCHPWG